LSNRSIKRRVKIHRWKPKIICIAVRAIILVGKGWINGADTLIMWKKLKIFGRGALTGSIYMKKARFRKRGYL
jgi:hypothetical protein